MKKIMLLCSAFALMAVLNTVSAQTAEKKEISKEVKVEEIGGEKVMTITTTENGSTSTEVYKGADADAKIKEMEKETEGTSTKTTKTVGPDGKMKVEVEKKVVEKKSK